jgi:magnesium chelatase subunit D
VREALLLLVTDGRRNVPFEGSVTGIVAKTVGRRGVTDAVEAAKAVAGLRNLRAVLLTPDAAPYPELPFELADAMGAVVISPALRAIRGQSG